VIVFVPAASVAMDKVATLLEFKAELPSMVVPLENVTVPVGVPVVLVLTPAVTVTNCSKLEGFAEELTLVLVVAFCTTWLNTSDVLEVRVPLPP
jgi:hypothetical protein